MEGKGKNYFKERVLDYEKKVFSWILAITMVSGCLSTTNVSAAEIENSENYEMPVEVEQETPYE